MAVYIKTTIRRDPCGGDHGRDRRRHHDPNDEEDRQSQRLDRTAERGQEEARRHEGKVQGKQRAKDGGEACNALQDVNVRQGRRDDRPRDGVDDAEDPEGE